MKTICGKSGDKNEKVTADIVKNGFDESKPLTLWHGHKHILIDGHTRLAAAKLAGLHRIPVVLKSFSDEKEVLRYAIKCQQNRRNLTQKEIVSCISELSKNRKNKKDNLKQNKKKNKTTTEPQECGSGHTAQEVADIVGCSSRTVEQARTVIDSATPEIKSAVESGEMTINAAYNATMAARKSEEKGMGVTPIPLVSTETCIAQAIAADEVNNIFSHILERLTKREIAKLIIRLQAEIAN